MDFLHLHYRTHLRGSLWGVFALFDVTLWAVTHRLQVVHAAGKLSQRQKQVELRAQVGDVAHLQHRKHQSESAVITAP